MRTLAHVQRPLVKPHHARKTDSHPVRLTAMRSTRCAHNRTRLLMRPVYRCCSVDLEFLQNLNTGNASTIKVRDPNTRLWVFNLKPSTGILR